MLKSSERSTIGPRPNVWPIQLEVDAAYADLPHVGNLELTRLFNSARVAFNRHLLSLIKGAEYFSSEVIAHIAIDFCAEVRWMRHLRVEVGIGRIGTTSYDLDLAIIQSGNVGARCLTTCVWLKDRNPEALSAEAKILLGRFT